MKTFFHGFETSDVYPSLTCYFLAIAVFLLDQFSKYFVSTSIPLGQSQPLLGDLLFLTHVRNLGAAFSLFWGHSGLLALFSLAVLIGVIVYQVLARPKEILIVLSLAFLLGGAAGNLTDRFFFGFVRDMFDLHWRGHNVWPIFNVADMAVLTGAGLLLLYSVLQSKEKETK